MSPGPNVRTVLVLASILLTTAFGLARAWAHEEPTSFLDLRLASNGVSVILTASATDLAHDLPTIEPHMLLSAAGAAAEGPALAEILCGRLHINAEGVPLRAEFRAISPLPETQDVRIELYYAWPAVPGNVAIQCGLFPYDPRHRTFAAIYENGRLERQEIFDGDTKLIAFRPGSMQGTGAVVRQFLAAGIHHIFIGPDHVLFIIGLLLLGGHMVHLLKIVTAFTLAHSITLGLATFGLLAPPASIIEPTIALSIVCVGVHAFLGGKGHDPRLLFAFAFGLIHGFGFANVLQEMALPRAALGWSLLAFNGGVELGQACIVAVVAPCLALLRRHSEVVGARVVTGGALAVTFAGAFWFFQRVIS